MFALDVFGTFVFALSGAFRAVKYELDLLGVMVLAVATGVGGGLLRDVMLGVHPPAAFRQEIYLVVCIAGGLAVFLGARRIATRWDYVMAADAVGLSVFAAIGAARAAEHGLGSAGIMFMSALTAAGGGVIRDLLVAEIPAVLRTDFYATAAVIGGATYVVARTLGAGQTTQVVLCIAVTFALRFVAMRYRLSLPRVHRLDASPSQMSALRKQQEEEE